MFMFIITRLFCSDCILKKNSFDHYLVFQTLLQFLHSMFGAWLRLWFVWVYFQFLVINYSDECCLLYKRLSYSWGCFVLGFCFIYGVLYSVSSIRSFIVSFVSAIAIAIICSVLYIIFLIISVSGTPVLWFIYWHQVLFKPLFFLWKLLHGFKLCCLTLFSPLFLWHYCNMFIEIKAISFL